MENATTAEVSEIVQVPGAILEWEESQKSFGGVKRCKYGCCFPFNPLLDYFSRFLSQSFVAIKFRSILEHLSQTM